MIDIDFLTSTFLKLLSGVPLALEISFFTVLFSLILGLGIAMLRLSRHKALRASANGYLFLFRTVPALVQIFLLYYGAGQFRVVRQSFLWVYLRDPLVCAIISLSLYQASYIAEIIRGGLQSVPAGLAEAARSLGMSRFVTFHRIILPLAIRQALPAYGNELARAVQLTALASTITLAEVTGIARDIAAKTFSVIPVFTLAGLIYLTLTVLLTSALRAVETRLTAYRQPVNEYGTR